MGQTHGLNFDVFNCDHRLVLLQNLSQFIHLSRGVDQFAQTISHAESHGIDLRVTVLINFFVIVNETQKRLWRDVSLTPKPETRHFKYSTQIEIEVATTSTFVYLL